MNKMIGRIATTVTLVAVVASSALAGPPKPKDKATCPVCHMALSAKKTKDASVPVKIGKTTMYCCSKCKMPKH